MKVGITGHRTPRIRGKEKDVECWISGQLKNLKACYKDVTLVTGMADGVDQIAAKAAIKLGIGVECYFPYKYKLYPAQQYIVDNAVEVKYIAENYSGKGTYINRDRKLVEDSDVMLVVWDGIATGGTYYTYKYSKTLGKNMFLYPWKGVGLW